MTQLKELQWETVSSKLVGSFFHFVKKWNQVRLCFIDQHCVRDMLRCSTLDWFGALMQPVLIQIPYTTFNIWNHPLVQVHVRGMSASGLLKRTFYRGAVGLLQEIGR